MCVCVCVCVWCSCNSVISVRNQDPYFPMAFFRTNQDPDFYGDLDLSMGTRIYPVTSHSHVITISTAVSVDLSEKPEPYYWLLNHSPCRCLQNLSDTPSALSSCQ